MEQEQQPPPPTQQLAAGPTRRKKFSRQPRLLLMLVLTVLFFILELVVGELTGSLALVADSFHMLSDVLALAVAFYAIRLAKKTGATETNSFGWQRAEILGALVNGVFLLALCFTIIVEAIQRFFEIQEIKEPVLVLAVGSAGLGLNLLGLMLFSGGGGHGHSHGGGGGHGKKEKNQHGHSHGKKAKAAQPQEEAISMPETSNIQPKYMAEVEAEVEGLGPESPPKEFEGGHNMRAVFLHVLGDALGSVGVIFVSLMLWLTDFSWRYYLDPVISLLITAMITFSTIPLVKETALVLLQGVPGFDFTGFRETLRAIIGVQGVHEVHVWRLADNKLVGSAHLLVNDVQGGLAVVHKAKEVFHRFQVHSSTIQTEVTSARLPSDNSDSDPESSADTACLLNCEKDCDEKGCCPREPVSPPKTGDDAGGTLEEVASV